MEDPYRWAKQKGGRVNESRVMVAGAIVGALIGAAASYLFFTESGKQVRDRMGEISQRKAEIDSTAPGTAERHYRKAKTKIDRGDFEDDEPAA